MEATYELFRQEGYSTNLIHDGDAVIASSYDYSGTSIRELGVGLKKMISINAVKNVDFTEMVKKLMLHDRNVHISNTKSHKQLDSIIMDTDLKECFWEVVRQSEGSNVTVTMAFLRYDAEISSNVDTVNAVQKKHEHALLTLEDNFDPQNSRYIIDFSKAVSCNDIAKEVTGINDVIARRRELIKTSMPGAYTLVFRRGLGGIIYHEVVGHQFEISKSCSRYAPVKFGKHFLLCTPNLSITDVPLGLPGGCAYDDEGTRKSETLLIRDGYIGSPLTDKFHLEKNQSFQLTGNGRRESYLYYPESRMYKLCVKKGEHSEGNILSSVENGFYVEHISYAYCSHKTGAVECLVSNARVIKEGCITNVYVTFVIDDCASKFFNVKMIGNHEQLLPGYCVSASGGLYVEHESPMLCIENINIRSVRTI